LKHTPVVQGEEANAGEFFPIIHTLFSNIKAWLVGTHHGVSAKHPLSVSAASDRRRVTRARIAANVVGTENRSYRC
jgi:hypothetical protein